ncbi:MAG: nucleoside triphosphate pyrophosphatase [Bacteriovoracaceae bacterium]
MAKLILASSSPYRKALLERLGLKFSCVSPEIDEDAYKASVKDPIELAETLAYEKAKKIQQDAPEAVVVGSDQLLEFQGQIFGKAGSLEKACEQLTLLSGKSHRLVTSYCVIHPDGQHIETNITTLTMRKLEVDSIKNYLRTDNPIDCAGSYKLELNGIALFEKIDTDDYTAIIGLPLLSLGNYLNQIGVPVPPKKPTGAEGEIK